MSEPSSEWRRKTDELVLALGKSATAHAEVMRLLKGDTDTPGVLPRIAALEKTINGESRDLGLAMKVRIMWTAFGIGLAALGYAAHPWLGKMAE